MQSSNITITLLTWLRPSLYDHSNNYLYTSLQCQQCYDQYVRVGIKSWHLYCDTELTIEIVDSCSHIWKVSSQGQHDTLNKGILQMWFIDRYNKCTR